MKKVVGYIEEVIYWTCPNCDEDNELLAVNFDHEPRFCEQCDEEVELIVDE